MKDAYERLRKRIDDLGTGFPTTESGVEFRILKRLFTEEEGDLFTKLTPLMETAEDVAGRIGAEVDRTAEQMGKMAEKGLLFRYQKGETIKYAPIPYIAGIFDLQVNNMDEALALDMDEYYDTALGRTPQSFKTPLFRAIPINRKLVTQWPIAPYEDALEILENHKAFAVVPCVCRTWRTLSGKGCDKRVETCLQLGSNAHHFVAVGIGRYITKEDAREILKKNEETGLVLQPFNTQKVGTICGCCGDCCGMLRSLKMQPVPAAAVQSNYFAEVDGEECSGCETCLERCQMEAIDLIDEIAGINLDRCIGCGLCVSGCPTEAMKLVKKPENDLYEPPKTVAETYMRLAIERGKNLMPQ